MKRMRGGKIKEKKQKKVFPLLIREIRSIRLIRVAPKARLSLGADWKETAIRKRRVDHQVVRDQQEQSQACTGYLERLQDYAR